MVLKITDAIDPERSLGVPGRFHRVSVVFQVNLEDCQEVSETFQGTSGEFGEVLLGFGDVTRRIM